MTRKNVCQLYSVCSICEQFLHYKQLGLKNNSSGNKSIRSVCKKCTNEKNRVKYHANHAESLRKVQERLDRRRADYNEYMRLWKQANPHKRIGVDEAYRQRRREREAAQSDGTLTLEFLRGLFGRTKVCGYCNKPFGSGLVKSLDHVIPLSKGGPHSASNVTVSCLPCNIAKSDHEVFLI
jgi:5-methylcytosine-specific restriction endonuclease McrA